MLTTNTTQATAIVKGIVVIGQICLGEIECLNSNYAHAMVQSTQLSGGGGSIEPLVR